MSAPRPQGPPPPHALARLAELDEALLANVPPTVPHRAAVQHLVTASQFPEAVKFVAFSLPRREGVWWAWVTAKRASGAEPAPGIKASLEATERWIAQPTDANRRAAFDLAEKADLGTPAGCAGAAAFFAGDSIAPPNVGAVPPGPYDCNKMIANAVILAAVMKEPEKAAEKFFQSLQQGLEVIGKIKAWPGDDNAPLQPPEPTADETLTPPPPVRGKE
jgi:hypothetical protein